MKASLKKRFERGRSRSYSAADRLPLPRFRREIFIRHPCFGAYCRAPYPRPTPAAL